nr:replication protein A 70 kDa DNA-binding subunit-like [Ipomoea batatas]
MESLIGMSMIFKVSLKKDQIRGPTSAYNVMRVIRDVALVVAYYSKLHDTQEKDLISRMIEENDDRSSDSDQTLSRGVTWINFYINQTEAVEDGDCQD